MTRRAGFTLIDVLVSLAVIGVLVTILLPSIARVRESAQRVVCGSNLRQIGLAVHMYAEDAGGVLPDSVFLPPGHPRSGEEGSLESMDIVRTAPNPDADFSGDWDGLGLLFAYEYLPAPKVFYCPSHSGSHSFDRYESSWSDDEGEIVSNYQFRGTGPEGDRRLMMIQSSAAIVSDMLRSYEDLNHRAGFNVLQAGLSVEWVEDAGDEISTILLRQGGDDGEGDQVRDLWTRLDRPTDPDPDN
ncbi:MAG: DUF1559 domain-containing protein [Planctomycetota bacterium]